MLGKTAGGLYWMFRYLERSENTARLVEAGQRIALTRSSSAEAEWASILAALGAKAGFDAKYDATEPQAVVDYLLRDRDNPASVMQIVAMARDNARTVRTALTREVWEAVNECYLTLRDVLARRVPERDLPEVLGTIRTRSAFVRGALHGTMMRNDIYNFARIGTFLERADNTARLLDVKYYVLLPSALHVGSTLDNVQWETILRAVSAEGAFRMAYGGDTQPLDIAEFLIFDGRMPRSLKFCVRKLSENLGHIAMQYGARMQSQEAADALTAHLEGQTIEAVFEAGLHEEVAGFIRDLSALGRQIEEDYRFIA
ncbi:alpha-E domain-containing protein [Pseudaestuariivita atlantica]|uniref:A alpha-helical domain with a conserved ER moti n=1 Tax=Pseudaestuariivita atlantica TaxID=1317121 RepID=A0A0L1JNX6_9RHOB|nr:alpha-E domain-containing protein [Pseudaestuariivita atlantica]KNG93123.1 A alpha-helical domain with a conserved ER moti [Pseudaestuariivita atlantica]